MLSIFAMKKIIHHKNFGKAQKETTQYCALFFKFCIVRNQNKENILVHAIDTIKML